MAIKAILFDLDGTLLPMDQDKFSSIYIKTLAKKMALYGYDPEKMAKSIFDGVGVMISNDGSLTNEEAFWNHFCGVWGADAKGDEPVFEEYYKNEFIAAKDACGFNEKSAKTIKTLKEKGYRIILATNPLFPSVATKRRMEWAGLCADDFELITTYDNSSFCKPNIGYYSEILQKIGVKPEEAVMVGNDVREDLVARKLGMKVFLLPEYIINRDGEDVSQFPSGDLDGLLKYIDSL